MLGRRTVVRRKAGVLVALVAAALGASSFGPVGAQVPTSVPPTSSPPTSVTVTTALPPTSSSSSSSSTSTSAVPPATTTPTTAPETTSSTSVPESSTTSTSTTVPPMGDDPPPGAPATSVSEASVADFLDSLERTPASSTQAVLDALRPLRDFGLTDESIAMMGLGRFPVGGEAYFRDDFLEYRAGPPVHGHQGNDIWAAFNAPVRSPADGVIRFEEGGLGGRAAYVTEANGTYYYLAHLNGYAAGLQNGSPVTTGQLIAYNGDTGNAKGGPPHVHFEIHPGGGAAVNPKPILDRWLNDALATAPRLLASYLPTTSGKRPVAAVGMARHFDGGLLSGPSQGSAAAAEEADELADEARELAEALVEPLTPAVLRSRPASPAG